MESIEARCKINGELKYRSVSEEKSYCLLGDKLCPFYREIKNSDYCKYKIEMRKRKRR